MRSGDGCLECAGVLMRAMRVGFYWLGGARCMYIWCERAENGSTCGVESGGACFMCAGV
ncbi:hypothetical protein JI435_124370 [Parastagonospora nodorum SN15]|uniref:Uncharacterized protein n=1 Tax=Phaeosphaeria nodorum (strain SN15 / ATCC MYA-4574 / FGSC 10173) TaxID=321614 RepID=A0A7U2ICF7_PHANO|nr:hypothetical protein JI435_124370 [Parastagonospora nodorum SN15]